MQRREQQPKRRLPAEDEQVVRLHRGLEHGTERTEIAEVRGREELDDVNRGGGQLDAHPDHAHSDPGRELGCVLHIRPRIDGVESNALEEHAVIEVFDLLLQPMARFFKPFAGVNQILPSFIQPLVGSHLGAAGQRQAIQLVVLSSHAVQHKAVAVHGRGLEPILFQRLLILSRVE